MRWTLALFVFFAVLLLADGVFVWLAFAGSEPVADSYTREHR
jgi:hypothetical protein